MEYAFKDCMEVLRKVQHITLRPLGHYLRLLMVPYSAPGTKGGVGGIQAHVSAICTLSLQIQVIKLSMVDSLAGCQVLEVLLSRSISKFIVCYSPGGETHF